MKFTRAFTLQLIGLALLTLVALPVAAQETLYLLEKFNASGAELRTINRQTGADLTTIGTVVDGHPTTNVNGLAMDPVGGNLFFINAWTEPGPSSSWDLCAVNLATAPAAACVAMPVGHFVRGLTFDSAGQLYGVTGKTYGNDTNSLLTIDKATGVTAKVADVNGTSEHTIAYDPATNTLYHRAAGVFESISIGGWAITNIGHTGATPVKGMFMVWDPIDDVFRFFDENGDWFSLTLGGVCSTVASAANDLGSVAFDQTTTVPVELQSFSID